jgi:(p)ppGpp synthase/HD superfamily hydrolase
VRKAHAFATEAHAGVFRKWTDGEPYVEHPARVAAMLAELGFPDEVVAAAFLHDVVEDTAYSSADLAAAFGPTVATLVAEVTNPNDIPKMPGNRPIRKAANKAHLARASYAGASIKLADMIDNATDIASRSPKFAERYLPEVADNLSVLGHGHPALVARLAKLLNMTT